MALITRLAITVLVFAAPACYGTESPVYTTEDIVSAMVFDDGRTLNLDVSECTSDTRQEVVETANRVVVTAQAKEIRNATCAVVLSVTLEEPLGDRELIDAYDDEPIPIVDN